jgi:hypothetical protein
MTDQSEKMEVDQSTPGLSQWPFFAATSAVEYWVDAWQRSILFLDVLRRRGNNYVEHNARTAPHVLTFDAELVLDGRSLARPVNYGLVRIISPKGTAIDPLKRPFIVFDPRRTRSRDRRHEARQRDRGRPCGGPSLLLRRLSA